MKLFALLFGAIGIILATAAVWIWLDVREFNSTANRTEGVVTKLEWTPGNVGSSRDSRVAYSIIRFDAEGKSVEFKSRTGSNPPEHAIGDKVAVAFQSGNPEGARLDTFWSNYLLPLIFGGLGIVFLGVSIGMFAAARRA